MEIDVQSASLSTAKGAVCLVAYFEGEGVRAKGPIALLNRALGGQIKRITSSETFSGKFLETLLIQTDGKIGFDRLVLLGLGKRADVSEDRLRQSLGKGATLVEKMGLSDLTLHCDTNVLGKAGTDLVAQSLVEGLILSLYRFDRLKTDQKNSKKMTACTLLVEDEKNLAAVERGAVRGQVIAEGVCYTRDLCTMPSNMATPTYLANEATQIAEIFGMSIEVLERDAIENMGMGAYAAVAQGTDEPPRFIVLHYHGAPKGRKKKPVVLIGKAVTFDTGGISLKPGANMEQMKYDMAGGATVLGVMKAVGALKLPLDIVAILPATDNMPSGKAIHPGDVVTSLSGKTIEIINTDAEGRLCLADALTYGIRFKPAAMINLATLTGACVVALGQHAMGMMGNNAVLLKKVQAAGEAVSERTWELPLWDAYQHQIESPVADLQNVGGRGAGTITAGLFLKAFVGDVPWVHLDIAGTSWYNDGRHPYVPKGASGVGVRLLVHYLTTLADRKSR
ncbi:leucyl aminopeptidase [Nitrospira defluvii]|nr:leucyl aminopeptidase [Nitrospira defluvii]